MEYYEWVDGSPIFCVTTHTLQKMHYGGDRELHVNIAKWTQDTMNSGPSM